MKKALMMIGLALSFHLVSLSQTLPNITSVEVAATVPDTARSTPSSLATVRVCIPSVSGTEKVNLTFVDGTSTVLYSEQALVAHAVSLRAGNGGMCYVLNLKVAGPAAIYGSTLKVELEDADGNKGTPFNVAVN